MDGVLILKKEKGYTSQDVVAITKGLLKEKVGHTGTLDPEATGVLPLLIGKGTKIARYLNQHDKTYCAILQLGKRTDTLDGEGTVLEEQEVEEACLDKTKIQQVLQTFLGKQKQNPPMYSAIKVKGKKLYEYARKGQTIEVEPRDIEIYQMSLENILLQEKQIKFTVSCSKGTYIRTLCEDIAKKLGTIGYMKELERTQVGEFWLQDAITIEELKQKSQSGQLQELILSLEQVLSKKETIILEPKSLKLLLHGVKLEGNWKEGTYLIYNQEKEFIGTACAKQGMLKREVIFVENSYT